MDEGENEYAVGGWGNKGTREGRKEGEGAARGGRGGRESRRGRDVVKGVSDTGRRANIRG